MPFVQDTIQSETGEEVIINIEVADTSVNNGWGNTRSFSDQTEGVFKKANALIRDCAVNIAETIHEIREKTKPTEIEVQFAVKIDTSVGVMIAQSSTGAQLQVTLKWGQEPHA